MNNTKKKKRKNNGKQHNSLSQLEQINLHAAGIDIGAKEHYVAVPQGRDTEGEDIRHFNMFTVDLLSLANWLKKCKVDTVAMESTSVYWIPLFEILDSQGFDVKLVNPRFIKNAPGRKTDVLDCQWIQQLHTYFFRDLFALMIRFVNPDLSGLFETTIDADIICLTPHSTYAESTGTNEH